MDCLGLDRILEMWYSVSLVEITAEISEKIWEFSLELSFATGYGSGRVMNYPDEAYRSVSLSTALFTPLFFIICSRSFFRYASLIFNISNFLFIFFSK